MGDLELLNSVVDISHWVEAPISLHAAAKQASFSLSLLPHRTSVFLHLHDCAVQLPLYLHLLQDNEKLACLAAALREMGVSTQ
jgi:hypothetical protein